jgi:hypothetical protein
MHSCLIIVLERQWMMIVIFVADNQSTRASFAKIHATRRQIVGVGEGNKDNDSGTERVCDCPDVQLPQTIEFGDQVAGEREQKESEVFRIKQRSLVWSNALC